MKTITYLKFVLISAGLATLLSCGSPKNDANTEEVLAELTRIAESQKEVLSYIDEAQRKNAKSAHIIVYGQVQKNDEGPYLEVVEYLKAPEDIRALSKLSLGEGVFPGRNIAQINRMVLAVFDEKMTIITIFQTTRGSREFESWRTAIYDN